jgi:KDO2-lipid IV(A) lauroyltransferase
MASLTDVDLPSSHRLAGADGALRERFHARPRIRRALGPERSVRLARARGALAWWLRPRARADALARAGHLIGSEAPPAAVRGLARANLVELAIQDELTWRPWDARAMPVRGLEHLARARAGGRGVVLATAHVGPSMNLAQALGGRGHRLYVATTRRLEDGRPPGARARWIRHHDRWVEEVGCRWVRLEGGGAFDVLRALLERGEVCWVNWDVRGALPMRVLGRTARVRSGLARLARETGAPVVPAFAWRDGTGQVAEILPALDPGRHDTERELMDALGARVEPTLRAHLAQAQPFFVQCLR